MGSGNASLRDELEEVFMQMRGTAPFSQERLRIPPPTAKNETKKQLREELEERQL